jgi:thiamine pyrophosphokinase
LDKALDYARNGLDAQHIRVFGATGGRLDHTYSALSALLKRGRHDSTRPKADIRLVDDVGETLVVNDTLTLTGPDLPGRTLSLMALGPVSGIWTTGVRWPLFGESLAPGVRDGTLNVVTETTVQVRAGSGDLLVLLHHVAAERAETTYGARPVSPP